MKENEEISKENIEMKELIGNNKENLKELDNLKEENELLSDNLNSLESEYRTLLNENEKLKEKNSKSKLMLKEMNENLNIKIIECEELKSGNGVIKSNEYKEMLNNIKMKDEEINELKMELINSEREKEEKLKECKTMNKSFYNNEINKYCNKMYKICKEMKEEKMNLKEEMRELKDEIMKDITTIYDLILKISLQKSINSIISFSSPSFSSPSPLPQHHSHSSFSSSRHNRHYIQSPPPPPPSPPPLLSSSLSSFNETSNQSISLNFDKMDVVLYCKEMEVKESKFPNLRIANQNEIYYFKSSRKGNPLIYSINHILNKGNTICNLLLEKEKEILKIEENICFIFVNNEMNNLRMNNEMNQFINYSIQNLLKKEKIYEISISSFLIINNEIYDIFNPLKLNEENEIEIREELLLSKLTFISFNTIDEFKILIDTINENYKENKESNLIIIIKSETNENEENYEIFYDINFRRSKGENENNKMKEFVKYLNEYKNRDELKSRICLSKVIEELHPLVVINGILYLKEKDNVERILEICHLLSSKKPPQNNKNRTKLI